MRSRHGPGKERSWPSAWSEPTCGRPGGLISKSFSTLRSVGSRQPGAFLLYACSQPLLTGREGYTVKSLLLAMMFAFFETENVPDEIVKRVPTKMSSRTCGRCRLLQCLWSNLVPWNPDSAYIPVVFTGGLASSLPLTPDFRGGVRWGHKVIFAESSGEEYVADRKVRSIVLHC